MLSKTTPSKTTFTHSSSKTSLSATNAHHRYTTRGSITNKRQDNGQIKVQTRTTTQRTSSRKEEVANSRSKDSPDIFSTVSTTPRTALTTSPTTLTTPSTMLTTPSITSTTPSTRLTSPLTKLTTVSPMLTTASSMLTDPFITPTESLTTLTDVSTVLTNSPTALNNPTARLSDPQNNGNYVFDKDQKKKMDIIKDAGSPTPTYSQKFRYFTFNLDQMIADLANDSDKEVAGVFTTTIASTAAPTAPTFPTLDDESLKNWQHLLPFILNTKAPLYLPPNIPVNIPAKSMPMTSNPQLVKHELYENVQTSSSESVMDERIKNLEQPKPIVLTFQKNATGNLLQDPVQDYSSEFGNMHPLHIRARDASLDLNDLALKGVITQLPTLFKGHRKKVYQAKLILEELPYEEIKTKYNAYDEDLSNADYNMLQESPRGALREMSLALPYSSMTKNNNIAKINKIREAHTSSNEISPSREMKASTETKKSTVRRASPAPIKYKKIIKKYIFKVPVIQLASNHGNIKQTTPSTKSAAARITHPGTMITKTIMKPKIITGRLHTDVNEKNHFTPGFLTTRKFNRLPTLATIFKGTTKWHTYKPIFTKYIVKVTPRTTGNLRQMLTNRNFITPQYTRRSTFSRITQKPTTLNKIIHRHT